ncbi:MAG: gliding motility-associated C-terminal domain-containing protein, partial [Bacteroidota bacterium]
MTQFLRLPSLCVFFLVLMHVYQAQATHNRAGEITYRQIDDLTIEATITTYTKESSIAADRDSLELCWGDGQCEWVLRINGPGANPPRQGQSLPNDTKVNIYIATHRYTGPGHFTMSMNDPNRNEEICNVNGRNSVNVPFHLETTVTLINPIFQGPNNSPILLQEPIDVGCVGQPFLHNPNAYDPDGDSLAYRLIVPLQGNDSEVPLYVFPDQISPGVNNNIFFNESTGDFFWQTPQEACEYNIAMYIIAYRNGEPLDTLIRDMQILIETCDNLAPEIEVVDEICVIAGETITVDVTATAPLSESEQQVNLTASGGPFELDFSPATFDESPFFQDQPLTRQFRWETKCEHIEKEFYTVIFRAADNVPIIQTGQDSSFLSTLKTLRIKVVGPPPEDVQAATESAQVEITWENPYTCEDAMNDYFRGFTVWRRLGSNQFPPDTCQPGLEGQGYTRLTPVPIEDIVDDRYYYLDLDVERGRTYCYRILANFARLTSSGFEFNRVESLPSEEICIQLNRDIPLITNVSVLETDAVNGQMEIRWTKPNADDLDTIANPGPYVYELWRATGITSTGFQLIPGATFTSPTFSMANDTFFFDEGLNTLENPYSYQVAFYASGDPDPIGFTPASSSVFLSIMSTDETNNLSWDEDVPWDNFLYEIFRLNNGNMQLIGTTPESSFSDQGLLNGVEYCYVVKSLGSYGIQGVPDSLVNFSQEACGVPLDTIPPCPPILEVSNI